MTSIVFCWLFPAVVFASVADVTPRLPVEHRQVWKVRSVKVIAALLWFVICIGVTADVLAHGTNRFNQSEDL